MAQKPETRYYSLIHKKLPAALYREKMYNPLRGGTPDVWYSGNKGDLWVEYKYVAKLPKTVPVDVGKLLSPLQARWLEHRAIEGRSVAVIVGSPVGGLVFEGSSSLTACPTADEFARGLTPAAVAEYIRRKTMR